MANFILKNDKIRIEVTSLGAELLSLQDGTREYMWCGDPLVWGRVSPILFPFVGGLHHKAYQHGGVSYPMTQHGFARDMEFTLFEKTEDSIWFYLESDSSTLDKYPFHFRLEIGYSISEKSVCIHWNVRNLDINTMYFSIGGHPGFTCDNGCYVKFENKKEVISSVVNTSTGLLTSEKKTYPLDNGLLPITEDLFDQDALVIENQQVHRVSLCDASRSPYLSVTFDAPLFGVWSMPHKQAPYICIEPWYGRCDSEDFRGCLSEREWGNSLEASETFHTSYLIDVGV